MTDSEINAKIAELCGWKKETAPNSTFVLFRAPDGIQYFDPPSYTTDLNACHEMEKTLTNLEHVLFRSLLSHGGAEMRQITSATARQRAEAFLKVKGVTV